MKLKSNVKYGSIDQAMNDATLIVYHIMQKHGYELIKTSVNDSKHGINSLHKRDMAFDCRSKHISTIEEKNVILAEIKVALTADFDALLEDIGGAEEHYHIEWDIKD